MTKVRTKETISIEKMLVLGKWLSSLRRSISSMLMISLNKEYIISPIHSFSSDTSFITPPGKMIIFFCFCRFFVFIDGRFDKLDYHNPDLFSALGFFVDLEWWPILMML
jgi:hypothetical protein